MDDSGRGGPVTGRRGVLHAGLALAALQAAAPVAALAWKARQMTRTRLVELRQYTLRGGRRDTLVRLFEREFVTTQEAAGIQVFGRFVDLDDPDRFVWMRGFESLEARAPALSAFYRGPVWAEHREAANATMVDSDNVLLLRPLDDEAHVRRDLNVAGRPLRVTIHALDRVPAEDFARFWTDSLRPRLVEGGFEPFRPLVSAAVANEFPRLPVRADPVFIWFMAFEDGRQEREFTNWWARQSGWRDAIAPELLPALVRKPEVLRLGPVPPRA
jgi:hypothetical protein